MLSVIQLIVDSNVAVVPACYIEAGIKNYKVSRVAGGVKEHGSYRVAIGTECSKLRSKNKQNFQ